MFTQVIARRRHMGHGVGRAHLVRARHQMMVAVLPIVFEKKKRARERDRGMCVRRGGAHPLHDDIKSCALYKSGWSQHGTHCNTLQRTATQHVQCGKSYVFWVTVIGIGLGGRMRGASKDVQVLSRTFHYFERTEDKKYTGLFSEYLLWIQIGKEKMKRNKKTIHLYQKIFWKQRSEIFCASMIDC